MNVIVKGKTVSVYNEHECGLPTLLCIEIESYRWTRSYHEDFGWGLTLEFSGSNRTILKYLIDELNFYGSYVPDEVYKLYADLEEDEKKLQLDNLSRWRRTTIAMPFDLTEEERKERNKQEFESAKQNGCERCEHFCYCGDDKICNYSGKLLDEVEDPKYKNNVYYPFNRKAIPNSGCKYYNQEV